MGLVPARRHQGIGFAQQKVCGTSADISPQELTMPSWTNKDERMYEHIKDSAKKRGTPTERAKEIAARTVNKERREEGRTPNKTTQGTGNPNRSLDARSKTELYNLAKKKNIAGRSKMDKAELVKALRSR
jgi:hypothetical protein